MADRHDHLHENGLGEVSDETIRRFLLGRLSASEQPVFEQRLFAETGLDKRVRLAELDLADDFAYGRLDDAERVLFEEKFLVSEDRRRAVAVSNILRERFAPAPVLKTALRERLRALPAFARPAWRYAFAGAILLILIGTAFLVIKEPRFVQRIAIKVMPRRSTSRSAPREASHPTNTSSPEHQAEPAPMPAHDQTSSPSVSMAWVRAALSDNNVPSVALPQGDDAIVRVQLVVNPDPGLNYRVDVWNADGQSVYGAESLKVADNDSAQINFDVPARLLRPGDYQVRLSRDNAGAKENVGSFYFRVQ